MDDKYPMNEETNTKWVYKSFPIPEIPPEKKGKLTGKDILEMCPGLEEAMDEILEKIKSTSDK